MFGLVDWSFIFTLGVILLASLIGGYLRSTRKDRCLKDFHGYHVTVERKDNRVVWGNLELHPTGFELIYQADVQDEGHMETSFVFYKEEFKDIQAIYRYARDLTEDLQKRRARSVERSFHPGIVRRMRRSLRNFLSTASDSMGEVIGVTLGRARKQGASWLTDSSTTYLKDMSKSIVGYVGTSYDPMLEKYVGTRVVLELVEDDEVHEHVGVLKEYSADFIELLDVYYPLPQQVKLVGEKDHRIADKVQISVQDRQVRIHNVAEQPQYVERISVSGQHTDLNAIIGGGEEIVLHLDQDGADLVLYMRIASRLDMIVPRGHALIRHRAERYNPDTIFDVGLSLVRRDGDEKEIERLRQVLRYSPQDAIAAAKLGELLMRRDDLVEAHTWLLEAQEHCYRLPDRGNRVAQNLRMVERRMQQLRIQAVPSSELQVITVPKNGQAAAADEGVSI